MKKLSFFVLFIALCSYLTTAGSAASPTLPEDITANGVYLYNIDNNSLIYEKNSTERMYPASLTKIMTCILALENTEDLDTEILTYPDYIQNYLYNYQFGPNGVGSVSSGGLLAGEALPMREMLYALMLQSANEGAMIIADHIGGSQEGFVEMMNARAKELGCKNTNFANPNGLFDENHYSTPEDMAILAMHARSLPGFNEIVNTTTHTYGPTNMHESITWETTNKLMVEGSGYYNATVEGIKTGTLPESGYCVATAATKDGYTYLAVVMGSSLEDPDSRNMAFVDTNILYNWVFSSYKQKTLVQKGTVEQTITLRLSSERDYLQVMTAERFFALVPANVSTSDTVKVYDLPESVDAPITKNDHIGYVTYMLGGEEIGRVELVAAETVSASTLLVVLDTMQSGVRSVFSLIWFKFAVIFLLLLVIAYIILMVTRNRCRKRRYGGYKPRRRL